ncbi:MAG: hypothetical protein AAF517_08325 [Planctomycetota bacterium]
MRRIILCAILFSFPAMFAGLGCESGPTSKGDASTIRQLREEADTCYNRFVNGDGTNYDDLECFVEKHRLSTEVYRDPALCPLCYLNYGFALRERARYFVTLRLAVRRSLESERDATRRGELEAQLKRTNEKIEKDLTRSLENYRIYASQGSIGEPLVFYWGSQQHYELGNYAEAALHLKEYIGRVKESASSEDLAKLNRKLSTYRKLDEREGFRREERNGSEG